VLADPTAYCKAKGPEGRKGGFVVAIKCEEPEQADQIVSHHDKAEGGFRGPKLLQTERVESKVLLEFPTAILAVGARVVDIPDLAKRPIQVSHIEAEAVVGQVLEEQLVRCLERRLVGLSTTMCRRALTFGSAECPPGGWRRESFPTSPHLPECISLMRMRCVPQ
jgi:hypothetical protein